MTTKIGINGFGRIGRQVLRAVNENYAGTIEVVAVNDLCDTKTNAHLLRHDSSYGAYPGKVGATEDAIIVDGKAVQVLRVREN
jgi:glyceraldehyde 3-phosphate dehydrogenase